MHAQCTVVIRYDFCTHVIVCMHLCIILLLRYCHIATINIVESTAIIHGIESGSEFTEYSDSQCVF